MADPVAAAVQRLLPAGKPKDLLSGTWMGHALHPVLTDFPLGAWLSGSFLDLFGGRKSAPAAKRLVGFGLAAAVPTMATGLSDWADTGGRARRIGVVHASVNTAAWLLYAWSYGARRRDARVKAALLGVAGGLVATAGGFFGGHLSLSRGIGVDNNAFETPPEEWTALDAVEGAEIAVFPDDGGLGGLARRCSHRGGPLDQGELDDGGVTCPWHGSAFAVGDGSVLRGPATEPQIAYEVREFGGQTQVRRKRR